MNAFHNFIRAAASYYGVPVDQLTEGCSIDSSTGEFEVVLRLVVTPEDLAGIGKRMDTMMREAQVDEAVAQRATERETTLPSDEELRELYNALHPATRSHFGSFARYKAQWHESTQALLGIEGALDVARKVELPAHVWVPARELTDQQRAMAVGVDDATNRYAMDPADLTAEQRAKALGIEVDDGMDRE